MQTFNFPKYSKVIYQKHSDKKYFVQSVLEAQETPIIRLPKELRLAPTKAGNVALNASKLILSKERIDASCQFITGIQETKIPGWYIGNDYEFINGKKVLSLMLFHFSLDEDKLDVYYFYRYDKSNSFARMQFAHTIIPNLINVSA